MDFRDLNYFETLAELGHLGRAAEKLCRTQSALSKSIRRLEEELSTELFERVGRRIVLTASGLLLLERARILRRGMEESKRQILDFSKGVRGHVRLGASTTMAESLLPEVSSRFLSSAPDVTMELAIGTNDMLRDRLHAGKIDLMLGPLEGDNTTFNEYPIVNDEVVIVAGPAHPIFDGPMEISALSRYRWVLASREASTSRALARLMQVHGCAPPVVQVETSSILFLPQLIVRNQLLTLLSRRNLGPGRPGYPLREVPIAHSTMQRTFGVLYLEEGHLSPAVLCLLNILRNEAAEIMSVMGA